MITSVSKGVFLFSSFVLFFTFSFDLPFWYRQGRTGVGREVGWFYKNGNKRKREEKEKRKEKKRPQKVWQSAKGWMSMIDFWIFFPSFFLFFYYFYFDIDDIHFVLALRPVTNHAHVFF